MSPQAVAHFERKGWPLRLCCYESSAKARTAAAAQQKQLKRQRAANNVEQRRAPGGDPQRKAGTVAPVNTVKKMKLKEEVAPTSAHEEAGEAGG